MIKSSSKTNPRYSALISTLKEVSRNTGAGVWREIAKRLEAPSNNYAEVNISKIAEEAHLNHNSTKAHLRFLKKANVVIEKRFGRIRIYKLNLTSLRVRAIKALFAVWENLEEGVIG